MVSGGIKGQDAENLLFKRLWLLQLLIICFDICYSNHTKAHDSEQVKLKIDKNKNKNKNKR